MNKDKQKPSQRTTIAPPVHDWMSPITEDKPCGVDLEYDPEFVVLSAAVAARADAQYGNFVGVPEPVNWTEVARECRALMMRSKDIRLAVLYTRCCTRLKAAAGLAEGMALLAGWLEAWPELIHPQPDVDEDRAVALEIRMNALQALTDTGGLLSDLREIALTRSTATRLQVRDVERAFAHPRAADALAPDSVARQIEELHMQRPSPLTGFDDALRSIGNIEAWCREQLDTHVPDLSALAKLLSHFKARPGVSIEPQPRAEEPVMTEFVPSGEGVAMPAAIDMSDVVPASPPQTLQTGSVIVDRHAALNMMRHARHWFEQHEPSSPIPVLLRRAEQFVGKSYVDVIKAVPADLLAQWESEQQT
ncbi:type VI secretion system protein TssA [Paraburkholderia caribensis]|uniref:type VI secretion system protein TssA n=1 Tax=Paraburkholderia caribensis TaxID=75105 RepID=UPI001D08D8C3|nr:type VI secretion system protein TssA [Paraburkholderia caribensis]